MVFADHFRGRSVLVTGHTGFKGSWLTLWLTRLGATVTGYSLPPETQPNLFTLAQIEGFCNHIEGDIRDPAALEDAFDRSTPDVVIHLAAQPLVKRSYFQPADTFEVNVLGTVNLLEAIRKTPSVQSAVLITTDKVYENQEWAWGYRENDPLGGHDPYSASKAAAELTIASYRHSYFSSQDQTPQVAVASARAGNVIGGGDWAEDRILPDAIRATSRNRQLDVRNPKSVRPWQHVLEPLGAYLALAKRLSEHRERFEGAWNFGPALGEALPVGQLVEYFFETLGKGSWREVSPNEASGPKETRHLQLNCEKAAVELDWQPVWNTRQAIRSTAVWYREVIFSHKDAFSCCSADLDAYLKDARNQEKWWAK